MFKKMRKTSNTLILVATPYFVEQIHISVWDRKSSTTNTFIPFSGKYLHPLPSFVLLRREQRKSGSIIFFMLGKLIFNHLKFSFVPSWH
jgi:hypothetical protein